MARVLIVKNIGVREELTNLLSFHRTQLQQITVEEHLFGEFVLATLTFGPCTSKSDHLTLFSLPTTFLLCPFLSASISAAAPFSRYTISNAFNSRLTSWMILAKGGVPSFESHKRFSPWAIYLGVDKLKHNLLSSSVISFPCMIERLKTQWKRKDCKLYILRLLRLLYNGKNSGIYQQNGRHKEYHSEIH